MYLECPHRPVSGIMRLQLPGRAKTAAKGSEHPAELTAADGGTEPRLPDVAFALNVSFPNFQSTGLEVPC